MRTTVTVLAAVLLAVSTATAWNPFPAPPYPDTPHSAPGSPGPRQANTAYDLFVNHFSADRAGTDILLQTRLSTLYPNSSITVTRDYHFDLLRYAREQPDQVIVKELEDITAIKRIAFAPPARRRDGEGAIYETNTFAGYKVAYGEHELTVIVATWPEGYSVVTQWHLIGDKVVADKLIHSTSAYCAAIRNAILVFDQSHWEPDHGLWESVQKASWDDVVLEEDFKNRLKGDYKSFFRSENVYKELSVPWKRGLIFLGPPGNGKTISLKAIMKDVKVPALYVKSFHTWGGDEMGIREVFTRARAEAPCVLILEDLDSLINDQNRSFFLNEVDGLEDNDGLLLIGTTNHFDRLDPALSSRPSRFDRKYSFPDPKKSERRDYAVYWQNKLKPNKDIKFPDSLLDDVADKTAKFSFAYLKEAFISALLTLAGREEEHQGSDFPEVLLDQIKRLREQLDEDPDNLLGMSASWLTPVTFGAGSGSGGRPGMSSAQNIEFLSSGQHGQQRPMGVKRAQMAQSSPIRRAGGKEQCFQVRMPVGGMPRAA